jgi:hypothetical protein
MVGRKMPFSVVATAPTDRFDRRVTTATRGPAPKRCKNQTCFLVNKHFYSALSTSQVRVTAATGASGASPEIFHS